MDYFAGLDVSLDTISVCIVNADGDILLEKKIKAEPDQDVYTISDDQLALWKQSAAPLKQKWADAVKAAGGDPDAIWKELQASLTEYNAGF